MLDVYFKLPISQLRNLNIFIFISSQVDEGNPPYPRSTALWWFYCKSASAQNTTTEPAALAARELEDEDEDNRNITVIRIHSDSGHL